jgi:hypothetical protein
MTQFIIAAVLVVAGAVLVALFLRYKAGRSERRMMQMLQSTGVDSGQLESADTDTIIKAVRQRCRKCQSEDLCERWLAGEEQGDNDFCPNAQVFEELKQAAQA